MTVSSFHILADNGIGGVIVIAIMIVGWAIKAMSSLQQKQKERDQRMLQELRAESPPPPPVRAPRSPAAAQVAQQMMQRARAMAAARQPAAARQAARAPVQIPRTVAQPARRCAAPPIPTLPAPRQPAPQAVSEPPPTIATGPAMSRTLQRPSAASATAPVIRKWLRPGTLRSQFILTEIFQKPVALREDHLV